MQTDLHTYIYCKQMLCTEIRAGVHSDRRRPSFMYCTVAAVGRPLAAQSGQSFCLKFRVQFLDSSDGQNVQSGSCWTASVRSQSSPSH